MAIKILYNAALQRKLRPHFRISGKPGVLLICRKCKKVIRRCSILKIFNRNVENIFCAECAFEMVMSIFRTSKNQDITNNKNYDYE